MNTATLATKLARLRVIEGGDEVFGSQQHKYQSHPQPESELTTTEAAFALELPAAYRSFLLQVGSGAGPYYGLDDAAGLRADVDYRDAAYLVRCGVQVGRP